jgi:anthraniloyl-CoA monooxygenase
MRIVSVGGGPAGLYTGILMKRADPSHSVTVIERNRPDDTFGFGVVFSDATLENLSKADPDSHRAIQGSFAHWDDIEIHWRGEVLRSTGHGFCGMERRLLLHILQERARALGVELVFEREVADVAALAREADLVLGADGVASAVRQQVAGFGTEIDLRPNRFVWLGTTFPFQAFTFYFKESEHGLFRVHAYRYTDKGSTFIVECTAETFAKTGLLADDEDGTIAYLERVFESELAGHRLIKNRSIWRQFPTVKNRSWHSGNVVLLGDAAHTAHFSIGSGTKLAMEDSIALSQALLTWPDRNTALARYEAERRPVVEGLQRAAQVSLEWFEGTERYAAMEALQFTFSLLTRSLRVSHAGLARRDPALVQAIDEWFAARSSSGRREPALAPISIAGRSLPNRLVGLAPGAVEGEPFGLVLERVLEPGDDLTSAPRPAVVRLTLDGDPVAQAVRLAAAGADAVLVGMPGSATRLGHVALADRVRNEARVTTIAAGGITTLDEVSTVVAAGRADLCLLG